MTAHPHELSRRRLLGWGLSFGALTTASTVIPLRSAAAAQDITVVHKGMPRATIVVGADEAIGLHTVAAELVTLIRKATGATLTIAEDIPGAQLPFIALGRRNRAGRKLGDLGDLGDDGYATVGVDRGVVLVGPSDLGTVHAAYGTLEDALGFRFLGERETLLPASDSLRIPASAVNVKKVPQFRFRQPHYGDASTAMFRHHRQLNGRRDRFDEPAPPGLDLWSSYWPEERYIWIADLVEDPSLVQDYNIKFMDPDAREQATRKIVAFLQQRIADGDDPVVGLVQADRASWQPDPASQQFIDAHGGARGAAMFDFANDVATRVAAVIPEARLEVEAYYWSIVPPKDLTIVDNVVITYCPIQLNKYVHLFHPLNQQWADQMREWAKIAKNLVLWDYVCDYGDYITPLPNWFEAIETIKRLVDLPQFQGVFPLGPYNTRGAEMAPLRIWLYSQFLRDTTLDVDAVVDNFLADYYGPAADHIRAYLDLLHTHKNELIESGTAINKATLFDFDTARQADSLLAAAAAAVTSDQTLADRVDVARFNFDHVVFLRAGQYLRDSLESGIAWDLDLVRRKRRCHAAVGVSGLSRTREGGGSVPDLIASYDTDPEMAPPPPKPLPPDQTPPPAAVAGLEPDRWVDLQDETFTIWPDTTVLVSDELASNHVAAQQTGAKSWGVQCWLDHLPETGTWQLWFNVRIDHSNSAPSSTAIDFGVYPNGAGGALPISDVSETEYREVAVGGTYTHAADRCLWVQNTVRDTPVYVDRVFAIRVD